MGDSIIQQLINNQVALEYSKPKIVNETMISGATDPKVTDYNSPLKSGYIALQAEGHPFKFKNIKILNLVGCMDDNSVNYKDYFVKNDLTACISPILGCTD